MGQFEETGLEMLEFKQLQSVQPLLGMGYGLLSKDKARILSITRMKLSHLWKDWHGEIKFTPLLRCYSPAVLVPNTCQVTLLPSVLRRAIVWGLRHLLEGKPRASLGGQQRHWPCFSSHSLSYITKLKPRRCLYIRTHSMPKMSLVVNQNIRAAMAKNLIHVDVRSCVTENQEIHCDDSSNSPACSARIKCLSLVAGATVLSHPSSILKSNGSEKALQVGRCSEKWWLQKGCDENLLDFEWHGGISRELFFIISSVVKANVKQTKLADGTFKTNERKSLFPQHVLELLFAVCSGGLNFCVFKKVHMS